MNTQTHNDTVLATTAGHADRLKAFKAWGTAEAGATTALVACFLAVCTHGATDPAEVAEARGWLAPGADGGMVPNGSAKAYAATFNRADKARAVLGEASTRDIILKASKLAGRVHVNVGDALSAVIGAAKDGSVDKATRTQAAKLVKDALQVIGDKVKAAATVKATAKRGPKAQDTATLAAASATSGRAWTDNVAAVRLASNMAQRLALPEGREEAARAYLKALADAAELGALLK